MTYIKNMTVSTILILWASVTAIHAQSTNDLASPGDCRKFSDSVIGLLASGHNTNAYQMISAHYIHPVAPLDIQKGLEAAKAYGGVIGDVTGYEKLSARRLGTSLIVLRYAEKHETGMIFLSFRFYCPKDHWLLETLSIDSNVDMDEQLKKIDSSEWSPLGV